MATTPTPAVRPSAIAGTWYPGSAEALQQTVEELMDRVEPVELPGRLVALVCPHAGYPYSGPTAAHAYAQVRGRGYDRVVLLGPLHRPIWGAHIGPFMVAAEDAYVTPLGQVRVDRAFVDDLGTRVKLTEVRGDQEHSLEIQLPFLQVALGGRFKLVPLMMGEHISDPGVGGRLDALAGALAEMIQESTTTGQRTLLLASTDLSHLDDYDDVVRNDRPLVDLVGRFDVPGIAEALRMERAMACGATGLVAVVRAAQQLGATGARVLAYATSGDVTGNKRPGTYTVGYMAAAVYA